MHWDEWPTKGKASGQRLRDGGRRWGQMLKKYVKGYPETGRRGEKYQQRPGYPYDHQCNSELSRV
jgi:hypothetical protein